MNCNVVIMAGRLTRDPVLNEVGKMSVCDFGLASGGTYKGKDGTEKSDVVFIDVVCFHQAAKYVAQYCRKGSSVLVEAKLQLDQWEDKNTGAKRSKHKLLANRVESMGSAKTEPAEEEF